MTNFLSGDVIYPIKKSNAYNMTQLKKVVKAEVVELKANGKIAIVRLISINDFIHPNKDGSPINSMLANMFSMDTSKNLGEGMEIEIYTKDFYKRKESCVSEHSKYGLFFYLRVLQNSI